MIRMIIMSLNYVVGAKALEQAEKLDAAFEGDQIRAVVVKDEDGKPLCEDGEFQVQVEAEYLTPVERCVERHHFDVIHAERVAEAA